MLGGANVWRKNIFAGEKTRAIVTSLASVYEDQNAYKEIRRIK